MNASRLIYECLSKVGVAGETTGSNVPAPAPHGHARNKPDNRNSTMRCTGRTVD